MGWNQFKQKKPVEFLMKFWKFPRSFSDFVYRQLERVTGRVTDVVGLNFNSKAKSSRDRDIYSLPFAIAEFAKLNGERDLLD